MPKQKLYMVIDTETATLPFLDKIAKTPKERQKIAIAKPLVYDIGWTIINRKGEILKQCSYLIQETFFVPQIFNTAYYQGKRQLYIDKLQNGEIFAKNWQFVINELCADLHSVDTIAAYNAPFDLKKAIPFTDDYITALYGKYYQQWENKQFFACKSILKGDETTTKPDFLEPLFNFYETSTPICDLWGEACTTLINNKNFKNFCIKNERYSNSKMYFSTNAETVFQYLTKNTDFSEQHTALEDAKIESEILTKIAKRKAIEPSIKAFPFRELGSTVDYLCNTPSKKAERQKLSDLLENYIETLNFPSPFYSTVEKAIERLNS